MLTCKDASRLVSEAEDRPLGLRERLGLRLHLWICANCRRYERQIRFLRKALRAWALDSEMELPGPELPASARDRIGKALAARDESKP